MKATALVHNYEKTWQSKHRRVDEEKERDETRQVRERQCRDWQKPFHCYALWLECTLSPSRSKSRHHGDEVSYKPRSQKTQSNSSTFPRSRVGHKSWLEYYVRYSTDGSELAKSFIAWASEETEDRWHKQESSLHNYDTWKRALLFFLGNLSFDKHTRTLTRNST